MALATRERGKVGLIYFCMGRKQNSTKMVKRFVFKKNGGQQRRVRGQERETSD